MSIKASYHGKGDYHSGIPATSLSEEAYAALDREQRALVDASPLYTVKDDEPAAEPDKPAHDAPTRKRGAD